MIKEAIEMLTDLKLHEQELEAEKKRLEHQAKRLEEELRLLELAVRQKMVNKRKNSQYDHFHLRSPNQM